MFAKKASSVGTPSVYSHVTRSTSNLKSTRSLRSLKIPWYRRPLVQDAFLLDIQRASMITAIYSLVSLHICIFIVFLWKIISKYINIYFFLC